MSAWDIDWDDPRSAILSLLLCGHVLADFLVRTKRLSPASRSTRSVLLLRGLEVGLVQGIVVLPFAWSVRGLILVLCVAAVRVATEQLKAWLDRALPGRALWWLLLEQAAQVGILFLAWQAWPESDLLGSPRWIGRAATLTALVVFNGNGGSAIVRAVLEGLAVPDTEDDGPKGAGRKIGILERWLILGLVWAGQWGTVGLVLTAKSVARFKKMDDKAFAETYLIGTMTSVIVAMASGTLLRLLLGEV